MIRFYQFTQKFAFSISLLFFLAYGQARSQSQQVKPSETPQGINATEWASIQKQIQMGKYKAYPNDKGGYASANLVQDFQINYQKDGSTTLSSRDCDKDFRINTRLVGIGYQDLQALPTPKNLQQETLPTGSKVTYTWNEHLSEWWTNTEKGLEQWFSIDKAPQGREVGKPLRLRMVWDTDMQISLQHNHLALTKNNTTLTYDKLKVWDATGKELIASMVYADNYTELRIADVGATYPLTIDPVWSQQAYLKASNTGASDNFGYSVAISGATIVVGATGEDSNATGVNGNQTDNSAFGAGAAYVFVRNGVTWTQQAYLKASNTEAYDYFGYSVAISGETIAVGAYREDSNATGIGGNQTDNSATEAGAAYVFVRNGTTWTQQAYLKASNTGGYDNFGWSVAISGETIVVGATGEDSNATGVGGNQGDNNFNTVNTGAVYVFVRSGNIWTQQAYLKASNTGTWDRFGYSVAISGETIAVGADGEESNATGIGGNQTNNTASNAGAVYVFVRNGVTWSQQAYLKASNTGASDNFGYSVAISGATIVVGAYREDSNATGVGGNQADNSATDAGAAYVFVRNGVTWTQQAYLKASNTEANDNFGYSVAISGETIAVGAWRESSNATGAGGNQSDNSASDAGAVYVFVRNGVTWTQQAYLKASNTEASDNFGWSVAISGETLAVATPSESSNAKGVGSTQTNNSAFGAGAVYVFNLPPPSSEINLKQNTASIISAGSYDFGAFDVNQNSDNITFTIENTGDATLNLTGSPKIVKSGANASDFTITETLPAIINANGSATFTISFTPSGAGIRTAQISIANNDSDENPYIVNLTGAGKAPEINLKQNTASIIGAGSYDFGAFDVNQSSGNITFTIENTGDAALNLTGNPKIVKSGANASDFTITETLPTTISANGSATFTINFTPSGAGTRTAQISIANNDSDENPYIVNLTGAGNTPIIVVSGNGNAITNGSTAPSTINHTNFANWTLNTPTTRTFTIENTGSASLNITSVTLTGADAAAFTIAQQPATTVAVGQSTTFVVSHTPTQATVSKNVVVNIANNSTVSPFTFAIRGSDIALSVAPRLSVGKVETYPNPAKDMLTISVEGNPVIEIALTLFDAQGKACLVCTLPVEGCKAHLPLRGMAAGLYLLHIQAGKEWITEKVVVVR